MKIPKFLLKKVYRKGSLSNTAEGCEFTIVNPFMFDLVVGGKPMILDGEELPAEAINLSNGEQSLDAAALSPENYFKFLPNTPIVVTIRDTTLSPGKHRILLRVKLKGAGDFEFPFDDSV